MTPWWRLTGARNILAARTFPITASALIAAGGAGFLPYHMSPDALLGALRVLAAGER